MKKVIHILNGDALKAQFPRGTAGTQIIMRECLVDGPVDHSMDTNALSKFYDIRSSFLFENYAIENSVYQDISITEIERIRQIPDRSQVYLWFEDDLFCQVNLWFVCHLLASKKGLNTSLVRPALAYLNNEVPATVLQYGFGGLDPTLLKAAFFNSVKLPNEAINQFAQLWNAFQSKNETELLQISSALSENYAFIQPTTKACLDLWNGHPTLLIQQIMTDLKTDQFGEIFQEFNKRGAIYGFGDLQVKRLLGTVK